MYVLTILLIILLFAIIGIKERKENAIFQKTNKDLFDNAAFPQYEPFFKDAILTYAEDLKICRLLGSDARSFRVASVAYKFTPYYAAMYFKAQCDSIGDDEELNKKYSKKFSKCAEFDTPKYLTTVCFGSELFPRKDFVRVKLKRMPENELVIVFAIPRDCIFDFNGETIF